MHILIAMAFVADIMQLRQSPWCVPHMIASPPPLLLHDIYVASDNGFSNTLALLFSYCMRKLQALQSRMS